MGLYPELNNLSLEQLIVRFWQEDPFRGKYMYPQMVAQHIRDRGAAGNRFLISALESVQNDEERLVAVLNALTIPPYKPELIQTLSAAQQGVFMDKLLSLLDDSRGHVVAAAIDGLWLQGEKRVVGQIVSLLDHPFEFVRWNALRYINRLYPELSLPYLAEASKDESHIVREGAAWELGHSRKREAIPYLKSLLNDPEPWVREVAQDELRCFEDEVDEDEE